MGTLKGKAVEGTLWRLLNASTAVPLGAFSARRVEGPPCACGASPQPPAALSLPSHPSRRMPPAPYLRCLHAAAGCTRMRAGEAAAVSCGSSDWQKASRRGFLEAKPRCSQLPRVRRVYSMNPTELLESMQTCASRRLFMRSDELLLRALTPLCLKRLSATTPPPLLALLAHTAVKGRIPCLRQVLQKVFVSMAARVKQKQETQTLSLLLSAYTRYACNVAGVPPLSEGPPPEEGPPEEDVDFWGLHGKGEESAVVVPFRPFIELLLEASGSSKVSVLRRVLDVMHEFSPWELSQLLPALLHLPGAPTKHLQQSAINPLLQRALYRILEEIGARAERFTAETAAEALRHMHLLREPAYVTEAALLVRMEKALSSLHASFAASRHLPLLQQVAQRVALPSSLSVQLFYPSIVPAISSCSISDNNSWSGASAETFREQQDSLCSFFARQGNAYADGKRGELPAVSPPGARCTVGLYVAATSGAIREELQSVLSCVVSSTDSGSRGTGDAEGDRRVVSFPPPRLSNAVAYRKGARSFCTARLIATPFPVYRSNAFDPLPPEGPLALLQAAALFDLTARPRTLVPDDISAAAAALYENRDALKRPSLAPVLGFLAASPLLTSLPDPLGSFLLSLGSLSPLPLARGGGAFARQSSLDILDRIKRQGGAAKGDVSDRGDTERGVPVQRRIQQYLEQWKALSVQPSVCVGSWAFADLAIDLQSLASHMQQCEAEGGHLQERAESSAASPPPSPAAQEEPAQEEPDATDTLEDGGRRQFFTACSQGGPDTSRVLQAANMRQARAEAAHSPSLPSPSCYTWRTDDGLPSASPNINAASHLLVCVLLECFDFVAAPPNSQRLGVHRKREALLCSLTKARLNALRRWGWAVICIREADWRAAEAMDSQRRIKGGEGPRADIAAGGASVLQAEEHRRHLILRHIADLAKTTTG
ncbi:hypothetical protein cyc_06027 [Cyclospora cayetanensis]|uniref:RAP domain-containing protein n=1 Tax=Cyclospora cayetanensis TaxID=88456 RepID=A0A1D3CXM4_9EIME|nr:hypothetical protein cyc_06027 [Cyclospora cayetanensis]